MDIKRKLSAEVKNNPRIWRFMDLGKFLDMVCNKRLFFVNPITFEDPYELTLPDPEVNAAYGKGIEDELKRNFTPTQLKRLRSTFKRTDIDVCCAISHFSYVNCWHISGYESAAMWDQYSGRGVGIAVQSSYNKLLKSIEPNSAIARRVNYIDYDYEWKGSILQYEALITKRRSFECEKELRLILSIPDDKVSQLLNHPPSRFLKILRKIKEQPENWKLILRTEIDRNKLEGKYLPINVNMLIENIYLSPRSPTYLVETIKSILSKFYLRQKNVRKSTLYDIK